MSCVSIPEREFMSMVVQTRSSTADVMPITNETLQEDIHQMSQDIGRRIDAMENGLAEKIKNAVRDLIADVKAELDAKLLALENRVAALEDRPATQAPDDRSKNLVIYEMAESDNENVVDKVNELIAVQLSLPEVQVPEAERKQKPVGKDAGVIVVKCGDMDSKHRIMEAKSRLNGLDHYKHIRIYQDKPRWQRQHEANVRLLVRSIGSHKLFVRGDRVCEKGDQQAGFVNVNHARGQGEGQGRGRGAGRGVGRDAGRGAAHGNRRGNGEGNARGGRGEGH